MTEPTAKELFKLLAPFLAATIVATLVIGAVGLRFIPSTGGPAPHVVSFDVIKYSNSQRAVASTFLKPSGDIGKANEILLKLPERTRAAISQAAGPGTLVLLKQAVVQGQTTDITDEVLTLLGLPTDVPTADATAFTLDSAPTNLAPPVPRTDSRVQLPFGKQVLP